MNKTPEQLRTLQQGRISEVKFRQLLKAVLMLIVFAWTMSILAMLCAIIFWPELADTLDQFIAGFGGLGAGVLLRRGADEFLDKLFD